MTAAAKLPLTVAETAIVDSFVARMGRLPGNSATIHARDQAVSAIKKGGLPTRKVEAWHYTDLRRLMKAFPAYNPEAVFTAVDPLIAGSKRIVLGNGKLVEQADIDEASVTSTADALGADVSGVALDNYASDETIAALNTAFVSDGVQVNVADGVALGAPIELQTLHGGGQSHTRNGFVFGAGANAMIVDRHLGSADAVTATNVTRITLRDGAEVTWVRIQDQGNAATHLGQIEIELEANAKLTLFVVNFSGELVREEVHASVQGEGADLAFRSVNLIGDSSHVDVTLKLDHVTPNTTSTETVRNVINGAAQGVFQGQIKVAQIAQKTDAQMACNTLLLSDEAGISVKPELEIFADDVICAHGATVTEISDDHLFYLMARGISKKSARGLLVKAFVFEIVEELEDEALVEALEARIDTWLEAHG
ncbi:MAG: Fe-S cluster assembly protein SufD [Ahrensia sp.]